jgi:hypothetical protein
MLHGTENGRRLYHNIIKWGFSEIRERESDSENRRASILDDDKASFSVKGGERSMLFGVADLWLVLSLILPAP